MGIKKNNSNNTYKYTTEELSKDKEEFKFVKSFFETTFIKSEDFASTKLSSLIDVKVYKVSENHPSKKLAIKRNNLMLYHGTNEIGVKGILKDGFKNSKKGWFGQGVYMTDCSDRACLYSSSPMQDEFKYYVFVNEVLESKKLQTFEYENFNDMTLEHFSPDFQFEKHIPEGSKQPAECEYKEDAEGRRFRNVPHDFNSRHDEYLADKSIVIPRYLIKFK